MSKKLSPAMRAALGDLLDGPLEKKRHGWARPGSIHGHSTATIEALDARDFVSGFRVGGKSGLAELTPAGRLAAEQAGAAP